MRITIKVNGKKISKKQAFAKYGEDRMKNRISEAQEAFYEDPHILCSWMDGMDITVTI